MWRSRGLEKMEDAQYKVIIDTDVLIDLLRGSEKVVSFIKELENRRVKLSTTVVNAFELYYGAYKSKKQLLNITATRKLLENLVVLSMNLRSAEKATQIQAEMEEEGQPIGIRDTIISAIALTKGYSLVTRNTAHMQKIKDIHLITAP